MKTNQPTNFPGLKNRRLLNALLLVFGIFFCHSSFSQQWSILGNESQISSVSSSFTSIAAIDNVPYVVYREGTVAKVKRRNSTTIPATWDQVGNNIGTNITYCKIFTDRDDNLYVTYIDVANGNRLAVVMYQSITNTWAPIGGSANLYVSAGSATNGDTRFSSTPRCSMAFNSNNVPYIAFNDGAFMTPYVKMFDGASWVTVGPGAVNTADTVIGVSLVIDEIDEPWLVYCDMTSPTGTSGRMALYHFTGGVWQPITTTITAIRHTSMARNSAGNLVIAYFNTSNTNRATAITYNKATNTFSSTSTLGSRDCPNISVISDGANNVYCSFIDFFATTSRSISRVFKQYAGASTWVELKDQAVTTGIDEPTNNLMIAVGGDTSKPYIVYTKTNSSSVTTPIVRQYIPPAAPIGITTSAISGFTATAVTAGGNISNDGGLTVTERGVVYGSSQNPTTANNKVADVSGGLGAYSVSITGLTQASVYYARAYAINSGGTTYGSNVRFNTPYPPDAVVSTPMQMEKLDRGLVAVRTSPSEVYVGWRLFGTDPASISFNVYRDGEKLNNTPITSSTNFTDATAENGIYKIKYILDGVETGTGDSTEVWAQNYLDIPLQKPAGGTTPDGVAYTYRANDCSVGDLDGDGKYEIILKWDPTNSKDNSQGGYTGNTYLDAYKLDGTRLWRIDMGKNIRAGAHYEDFMVYDLDGDGKAEMACKTADGTVDGVGVTIGDPIADYRNSNGYVLSGPEFLTVFNGLTGAAMATTNYVPGRGNVADWGDTYGNRVDRFIAAVAYLDGARPSLVFGRGYYTRLVRAAWDWRNGQLTLRSVFDSYSGSAYDNTFSGQGNHQMTVGDVDGDGKQEVINGSSTINDNGNGLWADGLGHGDALHMSDMDPDRPGLEIWQPYESPASNGNIGAALVDAKTGERIFTVAEASADVGRGLAADIDPRHKGYEMWAARGNLYNCKGETIGTIKPSMNFAIWWDGDLSRELLDGTKIQKWEYETATRTDLLSLTDVGSNNSTKATPNLSADMLGDWREEVIFKTLDEEHLRIYTTTIPTQHRIYTLMHDPQYRAAIAWQNSGYNQPPHPGFYLGTDMEPAPTPNIEYVADVIPPVAVPKNISVTLVSGTASITAADVDGGSYDALGTVSIQIDKSSFNCSNIGANEVKLTVTDSSGNIATAIATVTVLGVVPGKPNIAVSRTDATYTGVNSNTVLLGYGAQQLILTASNSGETQVYTYGWSPANLLSSTTSVSTTFTPLAAGTFAYTVTATSSYGCSKVSDPVTLTVRDVRCGNNNSKVLVCHKGKQLSCVSKEEAAIHLSHGCVLGNCGSTGRESEVMLSANKLLQVESLDMQVYPNPVRGKANITVTLPRSENYTVDLYDAHGAMVKRLMVGNSTRKAYEWNTTGLSKGVYFVRLSFDGTVTTKSVVVQ